MSIKDIDFEVYIQRLRNIKLKKTVKNESFINRCFSRLKMDDCHKISC